MYRKSSSKWRYALGFLAVFALPILLLTARRLRFSDFSCPCLFAFLVLHAIGTHYTYGATVSSAVVYELVEFAAADRLPVKR